VALPVLGTRDSGLRNYSLNVAALPYTLLIILAELAIGSLWITVASDLRGGVTRGFVMTMALCVAIAAGLAFWTAATINLGPDVDGYRISPGRFDAAKNMTLVVIVLAGVYTFAVFMGWDPVGRISGLLGSIAGVLALGLLAAVLSPPAWGYIAVLLALVGGTLAMGAVSVSMVWGHWYLTEGSLPAWPLRDLAVTLLAAIVFQALVLVLNASIPVRETPTPENPVDVSLLGNPAFWLRIGVGLVFPLVLAILSLKTTMMRAMQSATGLLYICMGAVFAGEVLAKGLMFLTAKPV
jgi:hypothetical protein